MTNWRYRLPAAVLIVGFGVGWPLVGGLNAHAWGLPEFFYLLLILPVIAPPLNFLFAMLFDGLVKAATCSETGLVVAQMYSNKMPLITGVLCWAFIVYWIGRLIDSRRRKQST